MTEDPSPSTTRPTCAGVETRQPRRHALALAALAAATLHTGAWADNTRWHLLELDLASNTGTRAYGINNRGQVVGQATLAQFTNPALWEISPNGLSLWGAAQLPLPLNTAGASLRAISDSGLIVGQASSPAPGAPPLATVWAKDNVGWAVTPLAGTEALAVNKSGIIAGLRLDGSTREAVGWLGLPYGTAATPLGKLPGSQPAPVVNGAVATGVNVHNEFVGYSDSALGVRAFHWAKGTMTDLGTLGGTNSVAHGINSAGTVVGYADSAMGAVTDVPLSAPVIWRHGVATSLGGPAMSTGSAFAINEHELVVGHIDNSGGGQNWAFAHDGKAIAYLQDMPGVVGSGWQLSTARGVNDRGQIVGWGLNPAGQERAFVMSLTDTEWRGGSGAWDTTQNWSFNVAPGQTALRATLAPAMDARITGPTGLVLMESVSLGGGSGRVELALAGGTLQLSILNLNGPNASLTGSGQVPGTILNLGGRIAATDLTADFVQNNGNGLVEGPGRIGALGMDNVSGIIRAPAGGRLWIDTVVANDDRIEIVGGELQMLELINRAGGGRIMLREGQLHTRLLMNSGRMDVSSGHSDVFGSVDNRSGGQIVVSGQGSATFWDSVINAGEIRVSAGAVASFFGTVTLDGGQFTGGGLKFFEAGYVGRASAPVEGEVGFGRDARLTLSLSADTDFDRFAVQGGLALDGTLVLDSSQGFVAAPGQVFDLLDWGTTQGRFSTIDASGLALAPGATLDLSRLYLDGSVAVVPEPGPASLWLAGLAVLGLLGQRRRASGG
jgi:MYXO-CTERM domain-containing protein